MIKYVFFFSYLLTFTEEILNGKLQLWTLIQHYRYVSQKLQYFGPTKKIEDEFSEAAHQGCS